MMTTTSLRPWSAATSAADSHCRRPGPVCNRVVAAAATQRCSGFRSDNNSRSRIRPDHTSSLLLREHQSATRCTDDWVAGLRVRESHYDVFTRKDPEFMGSFREANNGDGELLQFEEDDAVDNLSFPRTHEQILDRCDSLSVSTGDCCDDDDEITATATDLAAALRGKKQHNAGLFKKGKNSQKNKVPGEEEGKKVTPPTPSYAISTTSHYYRCKGVAEATAARQALVAHQAARRWQQEEATERENITAVHIKKRNHLDSRQKTLRTHDQQRNQQQQPQRNKLLSHHSMNVSHTHSSPDLSTKRKDGETTRPASALAMNTFVGVSGAYCRPFSADVILARSRNTSKPDCSRGKRYHPLSCRLPPPQWNAAEVGDDTATLSHSHSRNHRQANMTRPSTAMGRRESDRCKKKKKTAHQSQDFHSHDVFDVDHKARSRRQRQRQTTSVHPMLAGDYKFVSSTAEEKELDRRCVKLLDYSRDSDETDCDDDNFDDGAETKKKGLYLASHRNYITKPNKGTSKRTPGSGEGDRPGGRLLSSESLPTRPATASAMGGSQRKIYRYDPTTGTLWMQPPCKLVM